MNNFESQISQVYKDRMKDIMREKVSLQDLHSRKTDENMNIQKVKISIKEVF
jgi:hypothetical protein